MLNKVNHATASVLINTGNVNKVPRIPHPGVILQFWEDLFYTVTYCNLSGAVFETDYFIFGFGAN